MIPFNNKKVFLKLRKQVFDNCKLLNITHLHLYFYFLCIANILFSSWSWPPKGAKEVLYIDMYDTPWVRKLSLRKLCRTCNLCFTSCPAPTVSHRKSSQQKEEKKGFLSICMWKLKGIPVRLNMVVNTVF